ncbi:MAG: elongation factor P [Patescibacteria group bacterium]
MASPNDIKKGTVINQENELWVVMYFQRVSPGKGSSFVRTRMKNIKTGKVKEHNFKSAETLSFEDVQYKKMQYLYNDGSLYTFMDNNTFEQISVATGDLEDSIPFMKEGLEMIAVMHDGQALTVTLPQKIQYKIVYTEPAIKGDTASGNVLKEAELDNGLKIKVPSFINQGDEILVNTDTGDYTERVN